MPDQPILILGTRTLAEEIADLVSEIPGYRAAGFVENMDRDRCGGSLTGLPVYWVEDAADLAGTHLAVCGLATTHRRRYVEQVSEMGLHFATLVHPAARVSNNATLGIGCFVSPFAAVSSSTVLEEQVFVNRGALIGHHTRIGRYVTIQPGANIAGMVMIGEGAYIGMGAVILDKTSIGAGSVVGAGAVVTGDVPERVQVVGVPARIVKEGIEAK